MSIRYIGAIKSGLIPFITLNHINGTGNLKKSYDTICGGLAFKVRFKTPGISLQLAITDASNTSSIFRVFQKL